MSDFKIQNENVHDGNAQNGPQTSGNDSEGVPDLIRTLQNAYGNAIKHQTANPDSEAADLLLENASIRLSSRILSALTTDACASNESETAGGDDACSVDHESPELRDLTDALSYAASQLERVGLSSDRNNGTKTLETARVQSLEHLYRMTFAFSKAYLDRSQSSAYLEAAQEQLELARQHVEDEKNLASSKGYGDDLLKLFELSDRLSFVRTSVGTR